MARVEVGRLWVPIHPAFGGVGVAWRASKAVPTSLKQGNPSRSPFLITFLGNQKVCRVTLTGGNQVC